MSSHRRAEIFRRWSEFGHDEDWRMIPATGKSRNLPIFISTIFPTISDAPVWVNDKVLNNAFVTWSELVATLIKLLCKRDHFTILQSYCPPRHCGKPYNGCELFLKRSSRLCCNTSARILS